MTDVVAALRAQLGDRVDTDPDLLERARADKSGHAAAGTPLAVVHAASVDDVQATMRIATATATPSGLRRVGASLALRQALLRSTWYSQTQSASPASPPPGRVSRSPIWAACSAQQT